MKNILVIQTAFFGDVILATALVEHLHRHMPDARISMLVRDGNQSLLQDHPFLFEVLVWNKKKGKLKSLAGIISSVRKRRFDGVFNLQRFASTGLITALSGADFTAGFDKNPFAFTFTHRVRHEIGTNMHEVARNHLLAEPVCPGPVSLPKLYPSDENQHAVSKYTTGPYITVAPASVWFTKQLPRAKWVELIGRMPEQMKVYLVGAPGDYELCDIILHETGNHSVINLAGALKPLETAALMHGARMNYVNDSGPLHIASAMNAPVTAFFCSTIPAFGFGPLSQQSTIIETSETLECRPCGLHGLSQCPLGHFRCATTIIVPDPPSS